MLTRKLLLCSFLIICVTNLNAQRDIFSGHIINNNYDTIKGHIFSSGSYLNAKQCEFKIHPDSTSQTFAPGEILEYHFNFGVRYVSDSVLIGENYRHVFLEYIVNGTADLYYLNDDFGFSYFIRKEDGTELSLIHEDIYYQEYSEAYSIGTRYPKGLLKSYFSEDEEIHEQIDNSTLTHESMIMLVSNYHELMCPDESCEIYIEEKPKSVFLFSPMVGVRHVYLQNKYTNVLREKLEFNSSGLVYGFNIGYNIQAISKRSYVLMKAAFGNDYFYKMVDFQTSTQESHLYFHLNSYFTELSFLYDQAFGQGRVMPSVGVGPSFYFDLFSNKKVIFETLKEQLVETTELDLFPYPVMQVGFSVQLGGRINLNNGNILALTGSRSFYFFTTQSLSNILYTNNLMVSWYF